MISCGARHKHIIEKKKRTGIMTRSKLRENIFKIIFRASFFDKDEMPEQMQEYLNDIEIDQAKKKENLEIEEETGVIDESDDARDLAYIKDKSDAIIEKKDEIDKLIEDAAKGWSLQRIGRAELAILRVAVYEIRFDDDIPFKVAVNEALELSKKYCEPEAGAFINGILSSFAS